MSERRATAQWQSFFPDQEWYGLFTPTHLDHFAPKRGSADDPIPCLEVHYQEGGTRKIAVMMLAIDGFNDWDTCMAVMQDIGRKWAEQGWKVLALRLATAAWGKTLTPEEQAARGGRLIETYPDKRAILLVQGLTLDGRAAMASAELLRDQTGRIRAVRPWEIWTAQTQPPLRIESVILEAAFKGYTSAIGQLAYEAYARASDGGLVLLPWALMQPELRQAWEAAAEAVLQWAQGQVPGTAG